MHFNQRTALALCLFIAALGLLSGAYLRSYPLDLSQPDGSELELFASGDEYYNWLHDKDGFTVKQNGTGWYAYMDTDARGELVFTQYLAGRDDPSAAGLKPWAKISPEKIAAIRATTQNQLRAAGGGRAPSSGTLNNLAVFIRFSDQTEFGQNLSTYNSLFNGTTGNTMQSYFLEASYNALNIVTSYYPTPSTTVVSWQDSHPRAYYSPYSSSNTIGYSGDTERTNREFTLLVNAINGISSQVPTSLNLDGDNDGLVDNVCFIIKGGPDGWAELLWPHRWAIYDRTVNINGKRVYDFNFQLSDYLGSSGVGVLCHEMFHSLGSPDLYHYSYDGLVPVGPWDLMENDGNPPQHMSAYMKFKYGHWIPSLPVLSTDGTYSLNPLTASTGQCYRINSPNSTSEFFVVEYRRKTGTFENSLPGSGLLVYRINTGYEGNADGPPDEVYLYRPGGTTTANGTINSANYSSETGRTALNSTTSPTPFLTNGSAGGLNINTIGSAGATISFVLGNPIPGMPTCSITAPANISFFNLNSVINVTATASDTDGTITGVAFAVNGVTQSTDTTSPYAWTWNTTGRPAGEYTLSITATDNAAQTATSSITVTLLAPPDEGFESGGFGSFAWNNSSAMPWTVQNSTKLSGTYAAKSGAIGNNASTTLSLPLTVSAAGNISFYYKVSSEANYDYLKFYIDGVQQGEWSGEAGWAMASYPVSSGNRTFTWTYSKDGSMANGSDAAWLDHIIFPPHGTYYAPPQNLTASAGNGFVNLAWQAPSSGTPTSYRVYRNSNLLTTVTGLAYADNAVVNETTYQYYVTAVYGGGVSEASNTVSATPTAAVSADAIIGSGTGSNGTNTACPVNVYYESLHGQSVYTAAELNAAGITGPTQITALGFNVTGLPTLAMPNFVVRMGNTTAANVANWISTGLTAVWSSSSYQPTATGWNMYTLSAPFTWNGTSNLIVDTAYGLIGNWNQSGTTQYTSVNNGYRYVRNDNSDQTNVFTGGYTSTNRPNLKLSYLLPVPQAPEIVVSPLALDFGAVEVGETEIRDFTIQNTGNSALTGTITTPAGYTVSDSRSGATLKAAANQRSAGPERNAISFNLASGITWSYQLTFAPTAAQAYPGNVTISSNDSDEPTLNIALTGSGYVPPTISVPDSDLYASLAIGATVTDGFAIANLGSLPLTFSISEAPDAPWFSLNAVSGSVPGGGSTSLTGTFSSAGLAPGAYQTTLVIACNDPLSAEAQVNVNLVVTNNAPTIALPLEGFEFDMNTTRTVDFSPYSEDLDGHPLTLAVTPGSFVNATIDGLSVTFSAPADWFGSETLEFSVYDGYDYGYGSAAVTVNFVNSPPVITLPAGFEFDMNGSLTVDFGPYISDPDPQSLTLGYSGNSNIQVAIESAQVTFTAPSGWHGSEEITFSVYDGYAYSYDAATVTVNFVNHAPTIVLPMDGFEFDMNTTLTVDFSPYSEDLDGHPLTLAVTPGSFINATIDGLSVTFSAPADWFGSETLEFSVYDGYDYGYANAEVSVLLTSLEVPAVSIAKTAGGIDVWWPAVTNANRYQILRSFDPYGTYEHLAYADQPAYTDLGDFDRAFYRVKALYEAPAK